MSDNSTIEWTDTTWNPVTGCTEVSPGCDHCYAKTFAERWRGTPGHHFERGFDIVLRPERLDEPTRWKKPRRIFVNSMSDLFHESVPDEFIARVFAAMAVTPQHTYQLLTKRHGRMRALLKGLDGSGHRLLEATTDEATAQALHEAEWPLPNLWLGVSVENQQWADIRIPALLDTPAAVRWLSCEPLLGPVKLPETWLSCPHSSYTGTGERGTWSCDGCGQVHREVEDPTGPIYVAQADPPRQYWARTEVLNGGRLIDWIVVGGESGPKARPMHPQWARDLRDQCGCAEVPFFFKQWGQHRPLTNAEYPPPGPVVQIGDRLMVRVGKKAAGRELDGRTWDEYPAVAAPVLA